MAEVKIFFGSQTGTAESFAEDLKDEAAKNGLSADVVDLQTFTPQGFAACPIVVLVVATYGEGEPTDNAVQFHKWASDPRNNGALVGQRFTVMGLGDMNYSKFNNMGNMTDQNLERLGAKRIYQRGMGDDSQDIQEDFANWKDGGLWDALKEAVAEVKAEGRKFGAAVQATDASVDAGPTLPQELSVFLFFAQEEADGAAKDVCDAFQAQCKGKPLKISAVQALSDRKSVDAVRKMPRQAVAVVFTDCTSEAMCSAGRKLVRNMSLELDTNSLAEKNLRVVAVTVASSKCSNSAASLRSAIEQQGAAITKAFDRAGVKPLEVSLPSYVDAGVEDVQSVVSKVAEGLVAAFQARTKDVAVPNGHTTASQPGAAAQPPALQSRILFAGDEAQEAAEALSKVWPSAAVQDASLTSLAAAAQKRQQVVLAVECAADGSLSDAGRGLAAQLGAAPPAIKAQLKALRLFVLAVAATDYGNAGERASANAALAELTRAAEPLAQALVKAGATCLGSNSVDLQSTSSDQLAELAQKLAAGFAVNGSAAPAAPALPTGTTTGMPKLVLAAPGVTLPAEPAGEATDVLARFYFEAEKAKVLKAKELRQQPKPDEGLSTVEVEIEAVGTLKGYSAGGTFSLLPESDPADVAAVLPLLGLTQADLGRQITFVAAEGAGIPVKRPFPTPCTVGEALSRYCDLSRAPNKRMLQALQPKLLNDAAKECVSKLVADAEALKQLQAAPLCCRMHEFWSLLGVTSGIDLGDFLLYCPRQKAREYTIASSPTATPDRITLCVSLTSHQPPAFTDVVEQLVKSGHLPPKASVSTRDRFFGACSRWLTKYLKPGHVVLAKQRPSSFKLPEKDVPLVMVGAGAGVAPFRGFWEEIRRSSRTAPASLFFGCRHPEQDWLFKDEMNGAVRLAASGCAALARVQVGPKRPLTCLFTAFSRPGDGKESKYVQDLVKAQSSSIQHWVDKMDGCVLICGSVGMGNGVFDALAETLPGGKEAVEKCRQEGKIIAELWG